MIIVIIKSHDNSMVAVDSIRCIITSNIFISILVA